MRNLMQTLIAGSGLNEVDLWTLIHTAPKRYKQYTIPKRNGGERTISHPARELKVLQRILCRDVLAAFPVHPAATAYVPDRTILDNAKAHAGNGPILKFDFESFFPSIRASDWEKVCRLHYSSVTEEELYITKNLLFKHYKGIGLRLAIGAPSSPMLSNVIMFEIDKMICNTMNKRGIDYTRYADDLTFSAKRTGFLNEVKPFLSRLLSELRSPRLRLNEDKTVVATMKYKRMVTGLVLANDGRVTIGRSRKRLLRAALHKFENGTLTPYERKQLAGRLAFLKMIEPDYFNNILDEYGRDLLRVLNLG